MGTGMVEESSSASAPTPQMPNLARKGSKHKIPFGHQKNKNASNRVPFRPLIRLNYQNHCTGRGIGHGFRRE
jgi:hypothetical protein